MHGPQCEPCRSDQTTGISLTGAALHDRREQFDVERESVDAQLTGDGAGQVAREELEPALGVGDPGKHPAGHDPERHTAGRAAEDGCR